MKKQKFGKRKDWILLSEMDVKMCPDEKERLRKLERVNYKKLLSYEIKEYYNGNR